MVKFPEASARKLKNVFVCKRCKRKLRSTPQKILLRTIHCRNCGGKNFRTLRKIKVAAKA